MERKRVKVKVTKGAGRGKKIGIPTINFVVPKNLKVKHGIYAGRLKAGKKEYSVALHFGPRPVFAGDEVTLEAHIVGSKQTTFSLKEAEIEFLSFIRDIKNFPTVQAMVDQIAKDVEKIKKELLSKDLP